MKIAFVGAGNMAAALIGGMIERGMPSQDIIAIDPYESARTRCESEYGVVTYEAIGEVVAGCDMVVLAVKPQTLKDACRLLAPYLKEQLIVSIAAGVRLHDIARWLGNYERIVRAMPNTPALIGEGATGAFAGDAVSEPQREAASRVLQAVGLVEWVASEDALDSVTAISGSGPAYVF
jgi:pyrroline-5-carboxylate reductase